MFLLCCEGSLVIVCKLGMRNLYGNGRCLRVLKLVLLGGCKTNFIIMLKASMQLLLCVYRCGCVAMQGVHAALSWKYSCIWR